MWVDAVQVAARSPANNKRREQSRLHMREGGAMTRQVTMWQKANMNTG